MKTQFLYFSVGSFMALTLFSCSREKINSYESVASDTVSQVTSVENGNESTLATQFPNRKFIRTADIKCKVKDVAQATYTIEGLVQKWGGFVTQSQLSSTENEHTSIPISADSVLETTYFTVNNRLRFRIPNPHFDSSLKELNALISYLDNRNIRTDDISLQMLSHALTQKRVQKYEKRLDKILEKKSVQTDEGWDQESALVEAGEKGDAAYVENLSLEDKVDFSTVEIFLYQRQGIKREVVPSYTNTQAYEPHFGLKAWEALTYSLVILEGTLLLLLRFWWILIALGLAFIYLRKTRIKHIFP